MSSSSSIPQKFSLSPLQITRDSMLRILTQYQATPEFLNVLFKFGNQSQVFEESSGCNSLTWSRDGSYSKTGLIHLSTANGNRY